jgi:hypothetical protein
MEVPLSTGGSAQSGGGGGRFGKKKSMKQSIKSMFKSTKQKKKSIKGQSPGGANCPLQEGAGPCKPDVISLYFFSVYFSRYHVQLTY